MSRSAEPRLNRVLGEDGGGRLDPPDGLVLEWNAAAEVIFGYTQAEVQGRSLLDFIIPPDRAREEALMRAEALRMGTAVRETVRRRKDGIPLLEAKFRRNLARQFPARQQQRILDASLDQATLEAMPVHEYVDLYVI